MAFFTHFCANPQNLPDGAPISQISLGRTLTGAGEGFEGCGMRGLGVATKRVRGLGGIGYTTKRMWFHDQIWSLADMVKGGSLRLLII